MGVEGGAVRGTTRIALARGAALAVAVVAVVCVGVGAGPACGSTPTCEPSDFGLASATRLAPRQLASSEATDQPCTNPRLAVISSEADLRKLYAEIHVAPATDGGAPDSGAADPSTIDFSREHVFVREGPADEGVSWAVAQGDGAVVGLLSCALTGRRAPSCITTVMTVPAAVAHVESRTCDPVPCASIGAGSIAP
jgi:hypothetical protein